MASTITRRRSTLRQMRLVSIGTLVVALFTLGLILLIRIVALGLGQSVKENISLTIEFAGEDAEGEYQRLSKQIASLKGVKSVEYIDADDAAKQLGEQLGENPVDVLGYNPLSSVARLTLHAAYMQPDSLSLLEQELSRLGINTRLEYRGDLLEAVEHNTQRIELVLWGILALQALFAFIQINNTTRLMIYADRLKIRTLTLVGASPWFIRRPIIGRSILDALIATVLTYTLLAGVISGLETAFSIEIYPLLGTMPLAVAGGAIALVAVGSCALASARSTQRYIRMDGGKIHLV